MDLNQLRQALLTGESGTTFTFDPSNPAFAGNDWTEVRAFVTNSIDAGTLVVTGFTKPASSGAVIYEGTVPALFPQQDPAFQQLALSASAVFWLKDDGVAVITVSVTLPATWTFGQSISSTQETILDEVVFASALMTLSSADGPDPVTPIVVKQGTWLAGEVANAGLFAPVWPLLVIPGGIAMAGELTLATGAIPRFVIAADPLTGTKMDPFPFSVALGTYVTSYVKDLKQGATTVPMQFIEAGLKGVIDVGSGADKITFPVTVALADSDSTLITLQILRTVIPIPSWASLAPLTGYSDLNNYLPPSAPPSGALVLNSFVATIDPSAPLTSIVKNLSLDLSLNPATPWVILPNGILSISELGAKFSLVAPSGVTPQVTMYGVFHIETKSGPIDYRLAVVVPDLIVNGQLANDTVVPVSALADQFIVAVVGGDWVPPFPHMEVFRLDLSASPRTKQYSIDAGIDFGWTLEFSKVSVTFETLTFSAAYDGALLASSIAGNFSLGLPGNVTTLFASAETPGDGSWAIAAGTAQGSTIDLVTIIKLLLDPIVNTDSYNLGSLELTDLVMGIQIGLLPSGSGTQVTSYNFGAATAGLWTFTIGDFAFGIKAAVALQANRPAPASAFLWSGRIMGEVRVNDYVLGAQYDFTPTNWSLMFKAYYKDKGLTATFYTEKHLLPAPHDDTIVKVAFGNFSFGDIIEYLVSLARPGAKVTLGAPWNILYQLNFKDLSLIVNFTHSKVSIRYTPRVDFGFIFIEAISLNYERDAAGQGTVTIDIEGRFLNQTYTPQNPLGWDTMNSTPPPVPGAGTGLVDIRYVALGQRVGVPAAAGQNTVQGALDKFKAAMRPPTSATQNPLLQKGGTELQFDANSRMLFAAEFSLLENTVSAGVVMWDPYVYGFFVALGGPRSGSLAGLRFELLYKKVTDDIGVFKVELRIPEAFRQFEFGAVSITLGVIKVDIYTNGNFRVDLGFPRNANFADSFAVQVFPFIGFGGFYFALLNGQTSTTVPRITNGTFNPVVEAGIGLSIGVGKEFNKGVLKAGLSVSVYGIIEGTIAWFNPTNASTPKAVYFRLQGTAGIIGKLYGEVDFKIIKVSVSLTARASFTFIIQSYEPIYITLEVEVRVDASIKILFIRINFSFRLLVKTSFTIGKRTTPPWLLAPGQSTGTGTKKLSTQRRALRHSRRMLRERAFSGSRAWRHRRSRISLHARSLGDTPSATLNWAPVQVLSPIETVDLSMLPAFTLQGSQITGVMMLTAANTISPTAVTSEHAQRVAMEHHSTLGAPSEAPFNILIDAMLRWAVYARLGSASDTTEVTLVDLAEIQREMDEDAATESTAFSYTNLTQFIAKNVVFSIDGATDAANGSSGTIFPMIPELTMTAPGLADPVSFATYNEVGQAYIDAINAYFKQLLVDATADEARDPLTPPASSTASRRFARRAVFADGEKESLATVFFRDWFLMLTKSAVQSSLDLLEKWPYLTNEGDSLQSIADQFLRETLNYVCLPNDTISSIAALFGMTADALRALNNLPAEAEKTTPGEVLLVTAGVTPHTIAEANQTVGLNPAKTLTIAGVLLQVQQGSTLDSIAATYGLSSAVGAIGTFNETNDELLMAAATLTVPSFTHSALAGDSLAFLAAFYLSRNGAISNDSDDFAWYTQAIYQLNPAVDFSKPLAAGVALQVPVGYQAAGSQPYTTRDKDTQDLVAMYFCLVQQPQYAAELAPFEKEIKDANPTVDFGNLQPGTAVTIPSMPHTIEPGDTLASIAGAFAFTGSTTADNMSAAMLATANASADILTALSVLSLAPVSRKLESTDTIGGLAEEYAFSIEELADAIADQGDVFAKDTELTILDVPATTVADLLAKLFSTPSANSIASTVSRFLAYGLRLPDPASSDFLGRSLGEIYTGTVEVDCVGLYDLVGQQFPAPPVTTETTTISFTSSGVGWVSFVDPVEGALDVTLTGEQLAASYPSTTFTPAFEQMPMAMPNFNEEPVRTGLQNVIQWQASAAPPMAGQSVPPPNTAGEPTIWLFPQSLLAIAESDAATPYQLVTVPIGMGPDAPETAVPKFEWATLVPFTITTLSATASPASSSYVVSGADQSGRKLLLAAWEHLLATQSAARLFLLYAPNGASENPSGMASDVVDLTRTYLLKTNLSTETTSGNFALASAEGGAAPLAGEYYAGLDASLPFLQLLWEASVTGTGGFVLNYRTNSGAALPSSIFSQSGEATMWLLILLDDQSRANAPVRRFYPFNNTAIVGDNIDSSSVNLFAEASDGTHKTRVASIAAGNAGFIASLKNPTPDPSTNETPEQRTQTLFSLFGYEVVTAGNFSASNTALPAGPLRPDEAVAADIWTFKQVFAAARRANVHPLPDTPALPPALEDPYAGIAAGSAITVAFDFADIFGNLTTPTVTVPDLAIPFGYTDDVVGLASWPGLAISYAVARMGAVPGIALSLGLRYTTYVAGTDTDYTTAVVAASSHALRYKQIYYQVGQSDVDVTLTTSLDVVQGAKREYELDRWLFTDVVNGAYAFLDAASWLAPVNYLTDGGDTLTSIAGDYATDAKRLLNENRDLQAADVFAGAVVVPVYHTTAAGDTLSSIAADAGFTIAQLVALGDNALAPIPAGTNIVIPPEIIKSGAGDTLAIIASAAGCSIADVAQANRVKPFINGEILVEVQGTRTITTTGDSFDDLVIAFTDEYIVTNVGEVATAASEIINFLIADQDVTIDRRVLAEPTNLALLALEFAVPAATIADLNKDIVNLFIPSFPMLLSTTSVTPVEGETIAAFAEERNRVSVEQLAASNGTTALNASQLLRIPLQTSFSPTAPQPYVPYRVQPAESLDAIAAKFMPEAPLALAALNEGIAGTIAGGQNVTIGTTTITTKNGDSVGSSRVDLQACKLEYSIVSPK